MEHEIKQNLRNRTTWWRALYMLLFTVIYGIAEFVIAAVVLFQLLSVLLTGTTNERLLSLGQNLSTYLYQIVLFLSFNSDDHPYPLGDWPDGPPTEFD
jgi:hypothetical protein